MLKSANQDGGAPWSRTSDVTFRNNLVRHAGAALAVVGRDPHTEALTQRVTISNNVFEDVDGQRWKGPGIFLLVVSSPAPAGAPSAGPRHLVVDHNTAFNSGSTISVDNFPSTGFVFNNNIADHNQYGVKGGGLATGTPTLEAYFPGYRFARNALVGGQGVALPPVQLLPARPTRRSGSSIWRAATTGSRRTARSPAAAREGPTSAPTSTRSRRRSAGPRRAPARPPRFRSGGRTRVRAA